MAELSKKAKAKRASRPLVHAAKISDYRFRRVLGHFVRDSTAVDAGRDVRLSTNSVAAIYRKLRVFFFEVGLFLDFYDGKDPLIFESDNPVFEKALLEFHFARLRRHHGFRSPLSEPPYHFAESCWRYDFHIMMNERPADSVHNMMERHLLEIIRQCGPVGLPPRNRRMGMESVMRQADERIDWVRRNAPGFRDENTRDRLRFIRSISPV